MVPMRTLGLMVVLVSAAFAQDAPTPEQCRADYRVWTAKGADLKTRFNNVSYHELVRRSSVMNDCAKADPEAMQHFAEDYVRLGLESNISYIGLGAVFSTLAHDRMLEFLVRHRLMAQFMKEDEAATKSH